MTAGQLFARSPVVIAGDDGTRYEFVTHEIVCERAVTADGREVPAGVPVLTIVVRKAGG